VMNFSDTQLKTYAKGKRVLIVEDDRQSRIILKSFLKNYFPFIVVARNGIDGLKAYKKYKFDLIVTDINMPKMDGIQMTKEIKNIDANQPIMVISGDEDINHIIELIDIGIDSFIKKPIRAELVSEKILKILEHQFFQEEINKFQIDTAIEEYLREKNLLKDTRETVSKAKKRQIITNIVSSQSCILNYSEYSAVEFMKKARQRDNIDNIIDHLLINIDELEEEVSKMLTYGIYSDTLENISRSFSKIYNDVSKFDELEVLSDEIADIESFFIKYSEKFDKLSKEEKRVFDFAQYILDDIKAFVLNVFISPSPQDIREYEHMLHNSLEQITIRLENRQIDEDIEFF
jgi:DNA-binding NarL/FixJ family response regulator